VLSARHIPLEGVANGRRDQVVERDTVVLLGSVEHVGIAVRLYDALVTCSQRASAFGASGKGRSFSMALTSLR
jgi:hypothetical protein